LKGARPVWGKEVEKGQQECCTSLASHPTTTVPADPDGKRQHVVETCNFIDAGTSILLQAQV
jgi:hypothetical protein